VLTRCSLADYLATLEWSPERLAKEINRLHGQGTISPKAPYAWMKGAYPRGGLAESVAKILSSQLGLTVEIEQIWPRKDGEAPGQHGTAHVDLPWTEGYNKQVLFDIGNLSEASLSLDIPQLPPTTLLSAAVDWLAAEDSRAGAHFHGEEIPPTAVDILADRIVDLRRLDDIPGTTMVANWSVHELEWAIRMAHESSYGQELGVRLYGKIAELAQLAGWLLADLGQHGRGQHYLLAGLRAATLSGDRSLGAYILSCISYHLTWQGNGRDALRLLRIADAGLDGDSVGAVRSLLATRRARAHAQLGDERACRSQLSEAAEAFSTGDRTARPSWTYWVTPAVLDADAGRALLELGKPDHARCKLAEGLNDQQWRNHLLHCMSMAEACLELRQPEEAAELIRAALDRTPTLDSRRVRGRLRHIRSSLTAFDTPQARATLDQINSVLDKDGADRVSGRTA
jgi:tetratricopeptide (TPR) repeat protein